MFQDWLSTLVALVVQNPPANAGDTRGAVSVHWWGRSPGGGNGNPLQYSHLENPTDRGAWRATVHGVTKSRTWLTTYTHTLEKNISLIFILHFLAYQIFYIYLFLLTFLCFWTVCLCPLSTSRLIFQPFKLVFRVLYEDTNFSSSLCHPNISSKVVMPSIKTEVKHIQ